MDPRDAIVVAIVRVVEDQLKEEREKTMLVGESLRADRAALEEKERERSMLQIEKDRVLAVKEAEEKLVAEFLEADDGNKNFDEKAMMDAIVALIGPGDGDDSDDGEYDSVYGGNINF